MTTRNAYGALLSVPDEIKKLIDSATAEVETGIVFTNRKKGRWLAVNIDCYGYSLRPRLAVVQVRQSEKTKYGTETRKSYLLVGRNENGSYFSHAVSSHKVHAAIKADPTPQAVVRAVEAWIFGIKEKDVPRIVRQGDIALLPVDAPKGEIVDFENRFLVRNSHRLEADVIVVDEDKMYLKNATLTHLKGEHPAKICEGWGLLLEGKEAQAWGFALKNTLEARD